MTNAEKIIADLIDQQKITGAQAIELIKNLKVTSISTSKIWTDNITYNTNYSI